jgi:valyl-tRNA synthetase
MMNLGDYKVCDNYELGVVDKWMWSVLNNSIADVHKHIANYRFDLVANTVYDLVWNNYCDWYVEFAKVVLNSPDFSDKQKNGVKYTLAKVLESILVIAHPLIPFITESIYQQLKEHLSDNKVSIMDVSYPVEDTSRADKSAVETVEWLQTIVATIRNMRGEVGIKPSLKIPLIIKDITTNDQVNLELTSEFIKSLARVDSIQFDSNPPTSLSQIVEGVELNIPLDGLVDVKQELARLDKELDKLTKEVSRVEAKLSNERFVSNAPEAVVNVEKEKLAKYKDLYIKTLEKRKLLA